MSLSSCELVDSKSVILEGLGRGRVTKPMVARVAVVAKRKYAVLLLGGVANSLFDILDYKIL
jgi:hypothetical protein